MTLDEIFEALERDASGHILGTVPTAEELDRLEASLGEALPEPFRRFLGRIGGGLFYQGHEIFGPHRIIIHDIELVPGLASMRSRLAEGPDPLPPGQLPFHRVGGLFHLIDLRKGGLIVSRPSGAAYPDLATFLEKVILPASGRKATA